jgi:hypothetical protein
MPMNNSLPYPRPEAGACPILPIPYPGRKCTKRVFANSKLLSCSLCKSSTHLKCVDNYSNLNLEYVANSNHNWSCPTCLAEHFPFYSADSPDEIRELVSPTSDIDFSSLEELLLNPFECNGEGDVLDDLDPDDNFYSSTTYQAPKTQYLTSTALTDKIHSRNNKCYFSTLHLNIRS